MEQISSFNVKYMTVGACANFHATAVKYITAATPEALHLEGKFPAYQSKVSQLESIVNRQQAYVSTAKLKQADMVRDNAGGVITGCIHRLLTTPVEAKRMAAELLNPQVSIYRNIRYHEYTKQTAEVRGFLRVLDLPENQAAIATLGLTEEVEALRAANAEFEKYYDERAMEAGAHKAASNMGSKELIEDANTLYQEIVLIVNAYAVVEPSDEINEFITKMNGLIASVESLSGSSSTSKDDMITDDENPTETPEEPSTEEPEDPTTGTEEPENPDGSEDDDEPVGIPNP